jgi:hypothetical protein
VTDLPSAITARAALYRCSATLSSLMKGVSSVTRSMSQPSTEGLSRISRRSFVGHQPDLYRFAEPADGFEPTASCLQNSCSTTELRRPALRQFTRCPLNSAGVQGEPAGR